MPQEISLAVRAAYRDFIPAMESLNAGYRARINAGASDAEALKRVVAGYELEIEKMKAALA